MREYNEFIPVRPARSASTEGRIDLAQTLEQPDEVSKTATTLDELVKRVRGAQDVACKIGPSFLPIVSWYAYSNYWTFVKNVKMLGDTGAFLSDVWLDL